MGVTGSIFGRVSKFTGKIWVVKCVSARLAEGPISACVQFIAWTMRLPRSHASQRVLRDRVDRL